MTKAAKNKGAKASATHSARGPKRPARSEKNAARPHPDPAPQPAAPQPAAPQPTALLLRSDVAAFNRWRHAHLGVALDLRAVDLRGLDLRDAFLAGADLSGAQLDDAALSGALLAGANLERASLRRADLRGACFGRAELVEASLAASPLGGALLRGADLRGADLRAARAEGAVFLGADLSGADLSDADLSDADLRGARLEGATQGPAPPRPDESDAILARLADEPAPVREGLARFALLLFLAGDRGEASNNVTTAITTGIGVSPEELQRMLPRGRITLATIQITPPASDWARRVYFALMCGLASTSSITPTQLEVLGHFGDQFGLTDRAMARLIGEELGLSLSITDPE